MSQCIFVMPVYNEAELIGGVVETWVTELTKFMDAKDFKILAVNDGSKDKTPEILEELTKRHKNLIVLNKPNGGHGSAVLSGYRYAVDQNFEFVFQLDSDDQIPASEFIKLWQLRQTSPFVLGFRRHRFDAFARIIVTNILRLLILDLFYCWIYDANVPFRLIRRTYLKSLLACMPEKAFAPNIFLSVFAKRDGRDLGNVIVLHKDRAAGVNSINYKNLLRVCWRCFKELWRFRVAFNSKLKQLKNINKQIT